jgi:hypothetical protein
MSCTRKEFVAQLQSWVGLKESNGSHKKIIDIYNTLDPLPVGYRMKTTDAWCAATISAAAQVCKATDIIPTECSCPRMITKAQKMGIWVEADDHVPQPGDIVLYDWDDSGKGDNRGGSDHVGGVEKIAGKTITVIEGNYSNAVKRRSLQVNGRYIRGYIVPKFDPEKETEKTETKREGYTMEMRILSKGCTGEDVRALQILLIGRGYDCGTAGADGDFGSATDEAVRKCQAANILTVDGEAGPATMGCLLGL